MPESRIARGELHRDAWDLLVKAGVERNYSAGETLFFEAGPPGPVYAIVSGLIRFFRTTASGQEVIFAERGSGHLVGEMAAIDSMPRSASARVAVPSVLVVIPRERFAKLVATEISIAFPILQAMTVRLRSDMQARVDGRSHDMASRVASQLLAVTPDCAGGVKVRHDDLAAWIGVNRETVTRALARLRDDGLVATSRGRVVILDREALLLRASM